MHNDLRNFIELLKKEKELKIIEAETDPYLEIAEIHRRVTSEGGPALLFANVKGSEFPVATNLIGTRRRVELVMGPRPQTVIKQAASAAERLLPPSLGKLWRERSWLGSLKNIGLKNVGRRAAPILECEQAQPDVTKLPALTSWPKDGGAFITLPLVYTEHPATGAHNLGMYRIQIKSKNKTGVHWQIQKGGGFHYAAAEAMKQPLPVTVFVGGPLALTVAAITALPESIPELLYASFLMNEKLPLVKTKGLVHPLVASAEFAICGIVKPKVREPEGPFGDHYGYYSLEHDFPVLNVQRVFHRKDAIYPATVVGKPRQEDYWIGEWMQDLLSPLYPLVMPGVKALWNYAETGYHSLTGAIVRESYKREAMSHAFRILGEGQLSLTKILMLTDKDINIKDFRALLKAVLERMDPAQDITIIGGTSMDTLDYTGRSFNEGSKAIFTGVGQKLRELPAEYSGGKLAHANKVDVFAAGCLLVEGKAYKDAPKLAEDFLASNAGKLKSWPIAVLVDDIKAAETTGGFLWNVFTRFDPALDIRAKYTFENNKAAYSFPIVIDARMKPWYPDELTPDEATAKKVDARWKEYGL